MSLAEKIDREINKQRIVLIKFNLKQIKAAYYNNTSISNPIIAINKHINSTFESNGIIAHELGHHHSCKGNLLDMNPRLQIKYETLANRWALKKTMSLDRLIEAYESGVRSFQELTECLEIAPEFIIRGIANYESIYGPKLQYKGYTITWDPFNIESKE